MNKRIFISAVVMVVISLGMLAPLSALALGITSVTPRQVVNSVDNTITISGADFAADAQVSLSTYGNIQTTFVDAATLTAKVPTGLPPGIYTVTVLSGGTSVSLNNSLVIVVPTATPITPEPTTPPEPTSTPQVFGRPQLALSTYRISGDYIRYGVDFNLVVRLQNAGQKTAYNVQVVFTSSNLTPLKNGGVDVVGTIGSDNRAEASQQMRLTEPLYGQNSITADAAVTYYDESGTAYSEKFTLTLPVESSGGYVAASTATPTAMKNSQLVVTQYSTSIDPLQPGLQFGLNIVVKNMGNTTAQRVIMIIGGGGGGGSSGGTPQPGGVSGGSGQFDKFAPLGSSNVQSLGDLAAGATLQVTQNLIVNVSTEPGAYSMPITFLHFDAEGNSISDEQVITLLVYNLPKVDINFYTQLGPIYPGQPNPLPLQVLNTGKRMAVLANLRIETIGGLVENGTLLVGSLEAGGYTTLDATINPNAPGPLDLNVIIDYTDDFGQARQVTKTITLDVLEMPVEPTYDPNIPTDGGQSGGGEFIPTEETFVQKAWRFILGLFGLDSGISNPVLPTLPEEGAPVEPVPGGGGGGGVIIGPKG